MVKPLDSLSVVLMRDGYGSAFDVKDITYNTIDKCVICLRFGCWTYFQDHSGSAPLLCLPLPSVETYPTF